jgi:hypothetical protein
MAIRLSQVLASFITNRHVTKLAAQSAGLARRRALEARIRGERQAPGRLPSIVPD